jgi:hypothetical protein
MSWTAPMTAVSGQIFTASQFNIHIRDNLLETEAGTATTAGSLFQDSGVNSITEILPKFALVATNQTTTSASFTDLATVGPTVTVTTGTNAMVFAGCAAGPTATSGNQAIAGVAVSGDTTIAADTDLIATGTSNSLQYVGAMLRYTTLTPGSNTFTMKYLIQSGDTGAFSCRRILVLPM